MEVIKITGGHRFRIKDGPRKVVGKSGDLREVALSPAGFDGLKPKVVVDIGDQVSRGQELFFDKKNPKVVFTSPAGGRVKEIRYGRRRVLQAIVIELQNGSSEQTRDFGAVNDRSLDSLSKEVVVQRLLQSGIWQQLRTFPSGSYAPAPGILDHHGSELSSTIEAVYVSALNAEPHLTDVELVLSGNEKYFSAGVRILSKLSQKTFVFSKHGSKLARDLTSFNGISHREIENKYPAENLGTQVWYTKPLPKGKEAVGADAELVIDVGHLFLTGRLRADRLFSVAGNGADQKRHVLGRIGMKVGDLDAATSSEDLRFVAGGLLCGRKVERDDFFGLKESALQILKEDRRRIPFVFFRAGSDRLTLNRNWLAGFNQDEEREGGTSNNGEERACIQCGYCVNICPVGLMPVIIMKAAVDSDIEKMESASIFDCVDCGLCTFVCPSKIELAQNIESGKRLVVEEG